MPTKLRCIPPSDFSEIILMAANHAGKQKAISEAGINLSDFLYKLTVMYDSSHSSSTGDLPSYARPTRASRLRESSSTPDTGPASTTDVRQSSARAERASKRVTNDREPRDNRNGRPSENKFGYLTSTQSTINRFGHNEQIREQRCGGHHPSFAASWETPNDGAWNTNGNAAWPAARVDSPKPTMPTQIMTEEEFKDKIERHGISLRTRLWDNTWVHDPANNVFIDHDELFDICSKGQNLGKRCLFKWLRVNRPEKCELLGLHYLSDMDLGRTSVAQLAANDMGFFDYRHTTRYQVDGALEDLILLRNRVYHFKGSVFTAPTWDKHLYNAQLLAVLFYDEETATMARALRDRLRRAAEGTAQEIEAVGLFTALPFPGQFPWRPHHLDTISKIDCDREFHGDEHIRQEFSPSAIAATLEYCDNRDRRPVWDREHDEEMILAKREESLAKVEESLANVKRLENDGFGEDIARGLGRVCHQVGSSSRRNASANGHRTVLLRGEPDHAVRNTTRRGSFSFGGAAEDRSLL